MAGPRSPRGLRRLADLVTGPVGRGHRLAQPLADGVNAHETDDSAVLVDHDAELDARSEQRGEGVTQGRLRLDGRRARGGGVRIDRSIASEVVLVDPAQRPLLAVDEERVREVLKT